MGKELVPATQVQLEQVGPAFAIGADSLAPLADVIAGRTAWLAATAAAGSVHSNQLFFVMIVRLKVRQPTARPNAVGVAGVSMQVPRLMLLKFSSWWAKPNV